LHVLSQNESSSVLASTKNKQNIIHFSTEMLFLSLIWFLNNTYKKGIVQLKSTDACLQNIEQNNVVLLTNHDKSFMLLLSRTCCLLKASWCSWDMVQMDQNVNFVGSNATNQQWLPNNCVKSSYPELSEWRHNICCYERNAWRARWSIRRPNKIFIFSIQT